MWDKEGIVRQTMAAIGLGRHSTVRMRVSRVVIHKPGRNDYAQLKTYCGISLLSRMGRVVQQVVTNRLLADADRWELPSKVQFGSWKVSLAINSLAIMVDRAQAA
jgi:hypothetical protein